MENVSNKHTYTISSVARIPIDCYECFEVSRELFPDAYQGKFFDGDPIVFVFSGTIYSAIHDDLHDLSEYTSRSIWNPKGPVISRSEYSIDRNRIRVTLELIGSPNPAWNRGMGKLVLEIDSEGEPSKNLISVVEKYGFKEE